jgi:hypothetical protein
MLRHGCLFAACTLLLAWSGPINAKGQIFGDDDCAHNCAGQEMECLWASSSIDEECLAATEDPDQGVDEDDDSFDAPSAVWA